MIFSIPLYAIFAVFNMLIILPLSYIGSFIAQNAWVTDMQVGLQFLFRPLLFWQTPVNIPALFASLGWMSGTVLVYCVYRVVMMVANWFRGSNASLREVDTYFEN